MDKVSGYIGVLIAAFFAYLLLLPTDSSSYFSQENPKINFLDRLPASYFVRSFDNKYDLYKNAKKYEECLTLNVADECAISFSDFERSYQTLLDNSTAFYESERERYNAGVKGASDEFNSDMAAAAVNYSKSGVRQELSVKMYVANSVSLFLVVFMVLFRRKVGKAVMRPIIFVCGLVRYFHNRV